MHCIHFAIPPTNPSTSTHAPKTPPRLAVSQSARPSILTTEEEEIAWLQEEYAFDSGTKCQEWELIEEHSSSLLLIALAEKGCAPSSFPSLAGRSRLSAMVRLNIPGVKYAYARKRVDIRYALTQSGFRRDRSLALPDIPCAPAAYKSSSDVLDAVFAAGVGGAESEIICIDDSSGDESSGQSEIICIDDSSGDELSEHHYAKSSGQRHMSIVSCGASLKETNSATNSSEGREPSEESGASGDEEQAGDTAKSFFYF